MTKIDRDKLPPQDRAVLDRIQRNVLAPAEREQSFIGDLENLKDLWSVAVLQYSGNKKDVADSAGDASYVGTGSGRLAPPHTLTRPTRPRDILGDRDRRAFPVGSDRPWFSASPLSTSPVELQQIL
jgi:hypothetical protein